jgi:tyrosyl-tRNA synthetase
MPKKEAPPPRPWTPDLESDLQRILTVGEECISEKELKSLILAKGRGTPEDGPRIRLYDGFEPSGRMHIAQGLLKSVNVNKCTANGSHSTFCFWVADWFALMNDKMGGDLSKIVTVGKYLIEVWKAAGMDLSNVEFRWASDEITQNAHVYWPIMLDVARRFNVTRIKKCCQIMGRLEGNLTAAQVLYPLMQCTDVFFLKADICQLGVDQRKVNMLAREYCDAAKKKYKPVILSHHMLYGLKKGQEKMSKSDPDSAIFMEDTVEDVRRKITKAYCPTADDIEGVEKEGNTNDDDDAGKESMHLTEDTLKNPILDYVQHIVLSPPGATFTCATSSAPDGHTYDKYDAVKQDFLAGNITPDQLKEGLIDSLNKLLQPVRDHFTNDDTARGLLEQVREFKRQPTAAAGGEDDAAPKVFRLDLVKEGLVQPNSHLVMAPLPNSNPTMQSAADILSKLKAADADTPKVLLLRDWTARVNNALDADPKLIPAYHAILLSALKALDIHLHGEADAIMKNVTIVLQSEAILKDPSNYWISVINAGRHFQLDTVMGGGMKDSDCVGKVIGRLMMIGDVLGVNPKSIALDLNDSDGGNDGDDISSGMASMALDGGDNASASSVEARLIQEFYSAKLDHPSLTSILPIPAITHNTSSPNLALQQPRESIAHKQEIDEYFLTDDPKVNGKSKMKKAFCEPGNVDFCPPIELLAYFGGLDGVEGAGGGVTINRSPENGGDVTYTSKSQVLKDFESGALHPGDLKGCISTIMVEVLTKTSEAIKKDGDAAKGVKALKAWEKKMSKQKKK